VTQLRALTLEEAAAVLNKGARWLSEAIGIALEHPAEQRSAPGSVGVRKCAEPKAA
jgi:hypothetical protein